MTWYFVKHRNNFKFNIYSPVNKDRDFEAKNDATKWSAVNTVQCRHIKGMRKFEHYYSVASKKRLYSWCTCGGQFSMSVPAP